MRLPAYKTKIVCTIGPASCSEAGLERLMLQGINVARLNFAPGTRQGHREDIQRIRTVAARLQHHCMIMADLPGPKIRIGILLEEPLLLEKGQEIMLTVKDLVGTPNQISVDYKRLPESVKPGSLIFLNDGFIQLRVEKVSSEVVFCRTVAGGPLLSHKGLSIPLVSFILSGDVYFMDYDEIEARLYRIKNVWDPDGRADWYAEHGGENPTEPQKAA